MTSLEQRIYNTYLRVSRTKQNKPFRYRKNFDDFEDDPNYILVRRLGSFFTKFTNININDFFESPYNIYIDGASSYELKYYTTPKAIRVYGLYMKKRDLEDPDSDNQISRIKKSLLFIYQYCRNNNISVNDYIQEKSGDIPTFILHLRQRDVTIYTLYGFPGFDSIFTSISPDRLRFTIGEHFIENIGLLKINYYESTKAKRITEQGIKKLKNILNNQNKNI